MHNNMFDKNLFVEVLKQSGSFRLPSCLLNNSPLLLFPVIWK